MTAACNYDADAAYNDGSCEFSTCQVFGCNVSTACNFNEDATVNDGSCDFASCFSNDVEGCTNPMACNFDGEATLNDGSCDFTSCADMGCTDANACNYDVTATINDGSCVMATTGYDCFGNCIADVDGDGVCDMDEVGGCTDMWEPTTTTPGHGQQRHLHVRYRRLYGRVRVQLQLPSHHRQWFL